MSPQLLRAVLKSLVTVVVLRLEQLLRFLIFLGRSPRERVGSALEVLGSSFRLVQLSHLLSMVRVLEVFCRIPGRGEKSTWQSRCCVLRDCVGVGVMRHAYHVAQILRAQATHSQASSRSVVTSGRNCYRVHCVPHG